MIVEVAEFQVKDGMQGAFIQGTADTRSIFEATPGFGGVELHQDIHDPLKFIILVKWDSVQHHLDMQKTDRFFQIRDKVIDCLVGPPTVRYTSVKLTY